MLNAEAVIQYMTHILTIVPKLIAVAVVLALDVTTVTLDVNQDFSSVVFQAMTSALPEPVDSDNLAGEQCGVTCANNKLFKVIVCVHEN